MSRALARCFFLAILLFFMTGCIFGGVNGEISYRPEHRVENDTAPCPNDFPLDCGNFCCPSGTTCNANGGAGELCIVEDEPEPQPNGGAVGDACNTDHDCAEGLVCADSEAGLICQEP